MRRERDARARLRGRPHPQLPSCSAGVDFGAAGEGFLRFRYANSDDATREALARMGRVLREPVARCHEARPPATSEVGRCSVRAVPPGSAGRTRRNTWYAAGLVVALLAAPSTDALPLALVESEDFQDAPGFLFPSATLDAGLDTISGALPTADRKDGIRLYSRSGSIR